MTGRTDVFAEAGPTRSLPTGPVAKPPSIVQFLVLSAWCGLVSGLLEVGVIIARKRTYDFNKLY
jgi:hypothetical protein